MTLRNTYRPRVLLDLHGVLADIMTPTLAVANEQDGTAKHIDAAKHWDVLEALGFSAFAKEAVRDAWQYDGFCQHMRPYAGAYEAVQELQQFCDVFVVTSSNDESLSWDYDNKAFCEGQLHIPPDRVVFTAHKHLLCGDMFVDDKPANVSAADTPAFLWDQPYNRDADPQLARLRSWAELVAKAKQLAAQLQEVAR